MPGAGAISSRPRALRPNKPAITRRSNEYAAASTIIGNNIIIDAENDINVRASNLIAVKDGLENTGGNISLAAGNNVNILVDTG